ncbi:MAG: succinyl-CoA synthetase subunit beta, partial [Alphaproteobacteria bacterium]|nr:succinyl-CoA synthetase subunit beta [Alphaproteobacteria bacterium]
VVFSTRGGMDIESVPENEVHRTEFDYIKGLPLYDAIDLAAGAGVPNKLLLEVAEVTSKVVEVFKKYDCTILDATKIRLT